jgi:hypothetical protein
MVCGSEEKMDEQFQSAPAGEGGRCLANHTSTANSTGFNPRPPVKAGGALPRQSRVGAGIFMPVARTDAGGCARERVLFH